MKDNTLIKQLFDPESSTYTYLVADLTSLEAALIDPVLEQVERDLAELSKHGLRLKYILETHVHADHITGASLLRDKTDAKIGLSIKAQVSEAELQLKDGDELELGSNTIKVLETPGHTSSCLSYYFKNVVFTGDTLLISGTGRTDFQGGSAKNLFESVHNKLFTLPPETRVFPAHDYKGQTESSILNEMNSNPRLGQGKTLEEFIEIMANLNLPYPKKIDISLPANKRAGRPEEQGKK